MKNIVAISTSLSLESESRKMLLSIKNDTDKNDKFSHISFLDERYRDICCDGCEKCRKLDSCIKNINFYILEMMKAADIIILALPIYYGCISGKSKSFLEAMYPLKNNELKEMNKRKIHGKREIISKARKFIQENFIKDIKLADAAREVALSNYYFSHLFKKETGTSFIEYLTQVRIEKAKELLSTTEMEVINIAFYVGYNDANYFSHVFRKATGYSPKDFRQQLKAVT